MRAAPNPYRVLAHAIDVGDERLTRLLTTRLSRPRSGARAAFDRLVRVLGLD